MLIAHKKFKAYLRFWLTVAFVVVEAASIVFAVIYHIPALIVGAGIFVVYLVLLLRYINSYVNHYEVELRQDDIIILSGRLFRRHRIIAIGSVIFYERRVGVIGRFFGICSLHLHLTHRTVNILGLTVDGIKHIEEKLKGGSIISPI